MRIAFVSQPWNSTTQPSTRAQLAGSMNLWTYEITRRLSSPDDQLVVFGRGGVHERENNIEYWPINHAWEGRLVSLWERLQHKLLRGEHQRPIFTSILYYEAYIVRVALALRAWKPDVIHLHNFAQFAPIVRAFNPQARIVLHMHCEWLLQLDKAMLERRLRAVDLVLSTSDYLTSRTRERFPWMAERCQTVYNGVDVEQFIPPAPEAVPAAGTPRRKRLIYVGRLSPEKGLHTLLEAFRPVAESFPDVDLEIVGPTGAASMEYMAMISDDALTRRLTRFYQGPVLPGTDRYFTHLKAMISPALADRILWRGKVAHELLPTYYANADILVQPSVVHEAFGIPLVEAMACQLPVIATRSGGMPEVVEDGQTGLIVEREDPAGLAAAMIRLLEDDDLRRMMALAGRERAVQRFSWDSAARQLRAYYHNLCAPDELATETRPVWGAI